MPPQRKNTGPIEPSESHMLSDEENELLKKRCMSHKTRKKWHDWVEFEQILKMGQAETQTIKGRRLATMYFITVTYIYIFSSKINTFST